MIADKESRRLGLFVRPLIVSRRRCNLSNGISSLQTNRPVRVDRFFTIR